ncbi:MAG: bifunctional (p)ppGpp synthetase/guanosine-3',5'-bis(diphosphate) 3'-pyrophosphohydrolase [Deltaproteobacteria bacterium]|nr:bifunctional (p)ppGpp synthetase/guanosine-3',5'-bis(diphosphate) 3'-pyrophosphohydrolase [Deltaproteobacteria bacterium]
MLRYNDIAEKVLSYNPKADLDLLGGAYIFSAKVHQGQVRLSGEPYLSHPLEVAGILAEMKLDVTSIAAGLLHDTLEDSFTTLDELKTVVGDEIANIVDGVTKIAHIEFSSKKEEQAENFRKMILAMSKDIRIVLIKLADRLHNMRTLQYHRTERRAAIAEETLDIYAPLAHRLGIDWLKSELEDLSFRYVKPDIYQRIAEYVRANQQETDRYIQKVIGVLQEQLTAAGLTIDIKGRTKSEYGIYRKMESQNLSIDQVYDIIGFRIIVESLSDCYAALGIVHSLWRPIPGRFKDYIALPKANGYQSLHTAVIGPYGARVEVQIRSRDMNRIAEEGIASHWRYKEGRKSKSMSQDEQKDDERFAWLRQLLEWQRDLQDPGEFLDTVKIDLFPDQVYVFTPQGDVKRFPKGSTPVDFAYSIHTDVGNRCSGAKVNGKLVPLRYQLRNGDIIEILTSSTQRPSKDWLDLVVTARARSKIRHVIHQEERLQSMKMGADLLDREFRRAGLNFQKMQKRGEIQRVLDELNLRSIEALQSQVGYGKLSPRGVLKRLLPPDKLQPEVQEGATRLGEIFRRALKRSRPSGIQLRGVGDILVRFGKCCGPVPGDEVVGFITRGRGVTVHSASCSKALLIDPERRVDVEWNQEEGLLHPVKIRIVSVDAPGILALLSKTLSAADLNISHARITTTRDQKAVNTFEFAVTNLTHLNRVIKQIEKIQGVISVERLST